MNAKPAISTPGRPMTVYHRQGRRMRVLFIEAGVKQSDIAKKCGVSRFTVRDVCLGISTNPDVRAAISEALEVPAWDLWDDVERPVKRGRPRKAA